MIHYLTFSKIHEHIIYYVERIAICQEDHLLVAELKILEEEKNAKVLAVLTYVLRGLSVPVTAARAGVLDEEEESAILVVAVRSYPQEPERQLMYFPPVHKKYIARLTKMHSSSTQALLRDEGVSNRAKNRSLIRSLGLP